MDPFTIAAIGQGIAAGGQIISGAFQKAKGKKMARANKRPTYSMPGVIRDNLEIAESRADQGLSDASRQYYTQSNERGLNNSLEAILAGGGSVNNIGDIYGNFQEGTSKMALLDEEMRTRNVQNLINANNQMADYQDKEWDINVFAPYADKAQAAAALSKQGTDNIWKGINSGLGAAASYGTSQLYAREGRNVFGPRAPQQGQPQNGGINPNGSTTPGLWSQWNQPGMPSPVIPYNGPQDPRNQYPAFQFGNMNGGYDMNYFQDLNGG